MSLDKVLRTLRGRFNVTIDEAIAFLVKVRNEHGGNGALLLDRPLRDVVGLEVTPSGDVYALASGDYPFSIGISGGEVVCVWGPR